jgi:menaquinone-dependent protoporphyrinogen oxidase
MTRVLVAYASRHGSTAEIAERIGQVLSQAGLEVTVASASEAGDVADRDGVIIGSGVYMGHWLEPARDFIHDQAASLKACPVWLFSSGPLGDPDHLLPEGDPVDVAELLEASGTTRHRIFAGRLDKRLLGFGERAMVAAVRAPEGDFRDWPAIEAFAAEIAGRLEGT